MAEENEEQMQVYPPDGGEPEPATTELRDPAAESLSQALRVSFRLLTFIMILVACLFAGTGVSCIDQTEIGVVKVFGKVTRTAEPGLAFNWPFPIGEIQKISTETQELTMTDLFYHEQSGQTGRPAPQGSGLKPGLDGAVLTGDQSLLHVKLTCKYRIRDAAKLLRHLEYAQTPQGRKPLERLIRFVVCRAAILGAGTRTGESIRRGERKGFVDAVRREAQKQLNDLTPSTKQATGAENIQAIEITAIEVGDDILWPLRAQSAYKRAQDAATEAEAVRKEAASDAAKALRAAAGRSYVKLIGEMGGRQRARPNSEADTNLIGQYEIARSAGDRDAADKLLKRIDEVLLSEETKGEASRIINEARAYRTGIVQRVAERVKRFNELLPEYEQAPRLTLERLWVSVQDEILTSPNIEKIFITPGNVPTVLRISRDPDVIKALRRERLRADKEKREQERKR